MPLRTLVLLGIVILSGCAARNAHHFAPPAMMRLPDAVAPNGVHVVLGQLGTATLKSATGGITAGVGIGEASICNHGQLQRLIDSEQVYELMGHLGISRHPPAEAMALLDRQASISNVSTAIDIGTAVGAGIGFAGATKSLHMSSGLATALLVAPEVVQIVKTFLAPRAPSTSPIKAQMLQGQLVLGPFGAAGQCVPGGVVFVYSYTGDWNGTREGDIP